MELGICAECNIKFYYPKNSKYKRKYCDKCSKQNKKEYKLKYLIKASNCEDE